jgi:hypothetical protein
MGEGVTLVMNLPPLIERFVVASNTRDLDAFVTCFVPDAVVEDEGRTNRGLAEVRAWKQETEDLYRYPVEPSHLYPRCGQTIRRRDRGAADSSVMDAGKRPSRLSARDRSQAAARQSRNERIIERVRAIPEGFVPT